MQFSATPLAAAIRSGRTDLAEMLTVNLQKLVILGRLPSEELAAITEMDTRGMTCRQLADRVAEIRGEQQRVDLADDYEVQVRPMHWRDREVDCGDHLEPEGECAAPALDQEGDEGELLDPDSALGRVVAHCWQLHGSVPEEAIEELQLALAPAWRTHTL